jgi:uncharacterized protein YkwD
MDTRTLGVQRPRGPLAAARLLVAGLAVTLVATGTGLSTSAPAGAAQATTSALSMAPSTYETKVQRLVNKRRASHGLGRLRLASCTDDVAEDWSRYLARTDEFYHQSMLDVLNRCNAVYAGETLGRGAITPRTLVRMWMRSDGHRAVLLSTKSRRIGVGATPDSSGRWVVAANFMRF